ncbi:replicative DNA helicase [Trichothermofontia sp.]
MVQQPNFQAPLNDRLPPQNVEAEEAILGGILLDPEALGRIRDQLRPEAFYISAHQELYRAALALHAQGKPTDLMSVTAWLQDRGTLEKVGGPSRLAQLVDRTVSAVNIDQYAALVTEKYQRRKLIQAGAEIMQLGYEADLELPKVLDQAEQKIFGVTQDRPQTGLVPTADILTSTFSEIESRSLGMAISGIPCNFYDLDAMTQGFQRSDLVIVAGRPSMGKCLSHDAEILLGDGRVITIADLYQQQAARGETAPTATLLTLANDWRFQLTQPSAFVDDGLKPVFKVTTRSGRSLETTLTHPFLTLQGWCPLAELTVGTKIAVPRRLPVFGTQQLPEHQVKLLAYLIGDGCLTRTSPQFTNTHPTLQQDFTEAALKFPGVKVRWETSQGRRSPTLYVTSDAAWVQEQRQIFGQTLKKLLKGNNSGSERQIATRLGISPALLDAWQQGQCAPTEEKLQQLAQILAIPLEQLAPYGIASIRWMSQNSLTLWLKEQRLWGKSAHEKTIPDSIFTLARSQLALFLNRLFATDGWITTLKSGQVQLGFASVSEKLVRQVQHLLLRFGILADLKQRAIADRDQRRIAWQLDITDRLSLQTFMDEIGILGKEAAIATAQAALAQRRYQTNRDLIPIEVWEFLKGAKGEESWRAVAQRAGLQGTSNIHVGRRAPTRERLLALATALEQPELQNLATSDVYWDEIVEIIPQGFKQVYDLTIPETHNFVANDICVHNTSFVLNIARNIALLHKLAVAVFSLEMSKEQLVYRLLASEVGIDSGRLRSGRVAQNEWEQLGRGISLLSQLPIFIDDTPGLSVTEMRSQARRLQAEHGKELGLVLIDYLQLMENSGSDNRVQELSKITRSLKGLARELNVPVIALSQLSRGVESRTNKRPMMSDLRESGAIEQDSDLILMLYRDEYYNPDTPDRGIAEIIITKHRNGPTGVVKMLFEPQFTRFKNMAAPNR